MRFSIRLKLLGALAVDLLLMMVLGLFATHQMAIMNDRAVFIERRYECGDQSLPGASTGVPHLHE